LAGAEWASSRGDAAGALVVSAGAIVGIGPASGVVDAAHVERAALVAAGAGAAGASLYGTHEPCTACVELSRTRGVARLVWRGTDDLIRALDLSAAMIRSSPLYFETAIDLGMVPPTSGRYG